MGVDIIPIVETREVRARKLASAHGHRESLRFLCMEPHDYSVFCLVKKVPIQGNTDRKF